MSSQVDNPQNTQNSPDPQSAHTLPDPQNTQTLPDVGSSQKSAVSKADGLTRVGLLVLILLTIQDSSLVVVMKYASLTKASDGHQALPSTMVVMVECIKIAVCSIEISIRRRNSGGLLAELYEEVYCKPRDASLLLIPSMTYLVQNNFLLMAVANLDAVVYQVLTQMKILSTAIFSIIILQRQFTFVQWASLVLLTSGCIVVQLDRLGSEQNLVSSNADPIAGTLYAIGAATLSGFAGVFCERMLKKGGNLSVRNVQLGVPALFFGTCAVALKDQNTVFHGGFFQGYNQWTWAVIVLHSLGGLLVATVMKMTSNVAKTFAVAISVVVATLASVHLFNFVVTVNFALGSVMVVFSTFTFAGIFGRCCPTSPER